MNITKIFKIFVQIIISVLTGLLIFEEIKLYVSVPIHTTKYQKVFSPENIPDVVVCPVPGYNVSMLHHHGYTASNNFFFGEIENTNHRGWTGNGTNTTVTDMVKDISVMASIENCPFLLGKIVKFC